MSSYYYQYTSPSVFSNNLEIKEKDDNLAFLISSHGVLSRQFDIKHIASDKVLWSCKTGKLLSSTVYEISKPEHEVCYKVDKKSLLSEKFLTSFAGVEIKWSEKSFFGGGFIAKTADDDRTILDMERQSMWRTKGTFKVDLSAFEDQKAIHRKLMDPLNAVHQGWDAEHIKLDLVAFMLLGTYSLHRYLREKRASHNTSHAHELLACQ